MSVRGRVAAPAVAVEADPRTADPVTVAAGEDVVIQGSCISLSLLSCACELSFLPTAPLFSALLSR